MNDFCVNIGDSYGELAESMCFESELSGGYGPDQQPLQYHNGADYAIDDQWSWQHLIDEAQYQWYQLPDFLQGLIFCAVGFAMIWAVSVLYRMSKVNDLASDANDAEDYMAYLNSQAERRNSN